MRDDASDGLARLAELLDDERAAAARRTPAPVDPATRRRRRRRGLLVGILIVVVVLGGTGGYVGWALNAPVGAPTATVQRPAVDLPAKASVTMPSEGESAISVAGADAYLGSTASGVWQAAGGDAAAPMASISKLVTAMVILDRKPLTSATDPGPTLTFSAADHALYDKYYVQNATIAQMATGSRMTEHDALATMLVVSACNYAEAVSDWAYGSQAAFVSATRAWLTKNGLTHTRMVESTGLDARNVSTPADLITLGRLAMKNPAIAEIVGQQALNVPGVPPTAGTNELLGTDGVDGIKTGTLDVGSDLLFSAKLDVGLKAPLSIVGVVLEGYSRETVDEDVTALLRSIAAGFHDVELARDGDVVGTYATPWGGHAKMVLEGSAELFTWSDTAITATLATTKLTTGADGERVGTASWKSATGSVSVSVVLQGTIAPPSAWWRLTHPAQLGG